MSLPSLFNFPSQQTINTNVSLFDSVGVLSSNHDFINITNNPHLFASISAHDDAHSGLFSGLFGGGATVRWLHPWIGVVLVISFLGLFLRFLWQNLPEFTDFVWLARIRYVLNGNDQYLPEVGKYNAGQKFVFWSQTVLVATLFITGVGLWEPGLAYFESQFGFKATIDQLRLAALIHAGAAVLAITIWIIHVYAAIWVRGTISAMTRGTVSGGWGWRHHRKWLRKEVDKGEIERERLTAAE